MAVRVPDRVCAGFAGIDRSSSGNAIFSGCSIRAVVNMERVGMRERSVDSRV